LDKRKISRSVKTLTDISGCSDEFSKINPYSFELPNIPSISSKYEGEEIIIDKIHDAFFNLSLKYDTICIDGGAGLLTPINDRETMADILLHLNAELIIITKPSEMFISEVLETAYFAMQTGIPVAGYIVNGWLDEAASAFDYEQLKAIKDHVDITLLGKLPWFEKKDFTRPENHEMLIDEITQRFSLELFIDNKDGWLGG
jgi:dethiobiotin synthase